MATPIFKDDELLLSFQFPFHKKRLEEPKNKQLLSDVIAQLTGTNITITCVIDKAAQKKPVPNSQAETEPPAKDPLDTISNIFGSAEVLE